MTLDDVLIARKRIAPHVRRTPLVESAWLSEASGAPVALKLESLQRSASFKARGAFNAILTRFDRAKPPARIVTASAGNHGRGLAEAAAAFRMPLTVFTPADAPHAKLSAIRRLGADLRPDARDYDEAERMAKAFARETGADFVSPYNDPDVVAGAGTVALEILEDAPDTDAFVVPVGGGGLVAGMGIVVKAIAPAARVIGVELEASCPFQTSRRAGRLVPINPGPTLADGLAGNPDPDTITYALIERTVDDLVTVSESDLRSALIGLVEHEHLIAEGAGAAAPAGISSRRAAVAGRRAVAVVSGANIDRSRLAAVIG